MKTLFRRAFALIASIAVLGGLIATWAVPVSAESLDCKGICKFGFFQPEGLQTGANEVGVQFKSDIPGWIAAVCYWEAITETGHHTVTVWDSSGSAVGTATGITIPGQENCVDFNIIVPIAANSTYTASYTASTAFGVHQDPFTGAVDVGHLHAPANAAVLGAPGTFPTSSGGATGYGVDIAFLSTLSGLPADCTSTLTAPAVSSSAPGNASAVVSWGAATSDPYGCIAGYVVTPYLDGVSQPSTLIPGPGTTTVIKGLTNGLAYTFTIAAESGRVTGPSSPSTGPITVGAPTSPTVLKVTRVSTGAVKVAFKAPKRNNGAAIKKYQATCRSAAGVTKSNSGKSGPLTVTHLTATKKYRCTVRATNRRGTSRASARSAAVKA